jgi:hypothetical protein
MERYFIWEDYPYERRISESASVKLFAAQEYAKFYGYRPGVLNRFLDAGGATKYMPLVSVWKRAGYVMGWHPKFQDTCKLSTY